MEEFLQHWDTNPRKRRRGPYFREYRKRQKETEEKSSIILCFKIICEPEPEPEPERNIQSSLSPLKINWKYVREEALDKMEQALWGANGAGNYQFQAEWAFQMGWTSQRTMMMKGFEEQHPIQCEPHFSSQHNWGQH